MVEVSSKCMSLEKQILKQETCERRNIWKKKQVRGRENPTSKKKKSNLYLKKVNLVHTFAAKRMDDLCTLEGLRFIKRDLNGQFVNESVVLNSGIWTSPGVIYKLDEAQVLLRQADILILYV